MNRERLSGQAVRRQASELCWIFQKDSLKLPSGSLMSKQNLNQVGLVGVDHAKHVRSQLAIC